MVMFAVLAGLLLVLLVLVEAMRPVSLELSHFEAERREREGLLSDFDVRRAKYESDIRLLFTVLAALFLVLFVPTIIAAFGWAIGIVASVILALEYQTIARLKPVQFVADKAYAPIETYLLTFAQKARWLFAILGATQQKAKGYSLKLHSKEELRETLKRSPDILSSFEKQLFDGSLRFADTVVGDIMTPRSVIDSIEHTELLGPVTLSELHETGHSRFPVTDGDIDHVIGVLYVRDLLTIDGSKNSKKVSQVMDQSVCFIREDQHLDEALKAFIKTQKLLFIVVNEFRETVGLLSLEDVMEALLGQKITDEFEKHTDLRAVAERNPRQNNSPKHATDV